MPVRNIHLGSPFTPEQTPPEIFHALSVKDWEERDNDNNPEGSYLTGRTGDIELKITTGDHAGFEDYPYILSIHTKEQSIPSADEILDAAASQLLKKGFTAAREISYTNNVLEREIYSLDSSSNLKKIRQ